MPKLRQHAIKVLVIEPMVSDVCLVFIRQAESRGNWEFQAEDDSLLFHVDTVSFGIDALGAAAALFILWRRE